jgi:hypothetical protein
MTWLIMFRILSARIGRRKHGIAFLVYAPLDRPDLLDHINGEFSRIADNHGLDHDFGFLTPLDLGKRAMLEYDYYVDHTDAAEKQKVGGAMADVERWLDGLSKKTKGIVSLQYVFSQGCSRKEGFLYR